MFLKKEIIVVAPDQYRDMARQLSHDISKQTTCNAAFWTIKQFEDNEFQTGGNRYAIFIGNKAENKLTSDFLPVIKNLTNRAGCCYGFDGSKVILFGTGDLDDKKEFEKFVDQITPKLAGNDKSKGFNLAKIFLIIFIREFGIYKYILNYLNKRKAYEQFKKDQTRLAIALFLIENFDEWIGIEG